MDELISRQAALDAISCDITVTGRQNAELVAATIGTFADRIKALPPVQPNHNAEPGKMVEDCISRRAAIDAVLDRMNIEKYGRNAKPEEIRWTLEKLPSAQPEEASMILGQSKDGVRLWYQCSACGEPANADDNFCCNCGRKFRNG